jgi:hypothetical protein
MQSMVRSQAQLWSQHDRPRHRQRPALARLVALGVAVACFAAPLASLSHLAAHPHVRCQEHGELEDVPSSAHPLEDGAAPDPRTGHDHCVFGTHARHSQATSSVAIQGVPASLGSRPVFVQPPIHQAPLFAVYRFAPKTSPPA